ncbi:hypothetical protein [Ghiorsea bivora]|uniref:hypothetical protein n=1 Tax=Ghiorsea bivora TaxID=1485545 RepID=UPI0012FDAE9F|nr:hypothetical protein [Ghiorsea bivora]
MKQLYTESKQDRAVIADEYQRDNIVKHFVRKLIKLDDRGLGAVHSDKNQDDLTALKREIEDLTYTYTHKVRPVLLNNIKLKRKDNGARMNKVELSKLMFASKYNHKTRKPIVGIFSYQQDIDDSLFGEKLVQAGLFVNFPELKEAPWVKQALKMDVELTAFRRMHLAYMDGIKFSYKQLKKSSVQKSMAPEQSIVSDWPAYKREKVVRKFVRKMQKLDDKQPFSAFKQDLVTLIATFEHTVKPILIDNINMKRFDIGARANKGDLISLFYPSNRNYKTGKPISSKLYHGGSSEHDLGYLVVQPELAQDDVVQSALVMETELAKLLKEHRIYLKAYKSLMW